MFKFIQKIFRKKNNLDECVASINFKLNHNSSFDIVCSWPDLHNLSASDMELLSEQYAKLLYAINSGALAKDVADILSNKNCLTLKTENPIDFYFSNQVLDKWLSLFNIQSYLSNDPLIKPSSVFRNYK